MTLAEKRARINVLKAELCIEFMKSKLKPPKDIFEAINLSIILLSLIMDIRIIQSIPTYHKGGIAICGENKKEIILKPNR